MNGVILSPKAKSDLAKVWDYTLTEWGVDQAEKNIRELCSVIEEQVTDLTKALVLNDKRGKQQRG